MDLEPEGITTPCTPSNALASRHAASDRRACHWTDGDPLDVAQLSAPRAAKPAKDLIQRQMSQRDEGLLRRHVHVTPATAIDPETVVLLDEVFCCAVQECVGWHVGVMPALGGGGKGSA